MSDDGYILQLEEEKESCAKKITQYLSASNSSGNPLVNNKGCIANMEELFRKRSPSLRSIIERKSINNQ